MTADVGGDEDVNEDTREDTAVTADDGGVEDVDEEEERGEDAEDTADVAVDTGPMVYTDPTGGSL